MLTGVGKQTLTGVGNPKGETRARTEGGSEHITGPGTQIPMQESQNSVFSLQIEGIGIANGEKLHQNGGTDLEQSQADLTPGQRKVKLKQPKLIFKSTVTQKIKGGQRDHEAQLNTNLVVKSSSEEGAQLQIWSTETSKQTSED